MNPKGKKLLSLFLIFSLIMINCATLSRLEEKREKRKKHGANLIIQKINGQQVSGELITVKPSSLLLLNTEGKDVSIDIADIKVIRVVKKSQVVKGAFGGLLGGAGTGAYFAGLFGLVIRASWGETSSKMAEWGAICAPFGAIIGAIIGAIFSIDKTIQIEGMSDIEIQKTLDKLRKKARIRDYK
jgi:hypothetical protein